MIFTFLYGIDSIFRINNSLVFFNIAYFLSWVISLVGWILVKDGKSLKKNSLGFVFFPMFPFAITLLCYGAELHEFDVQRMLILGGIYLLILICSLICIEIKKKKAGCKKNGLIMFPIAISGLMLFTHSCIDLISIFENFLNVFVWLSILEIVFFYLKVFLASFDFEEEKHKRINLISNIIFWIYFSIYDLASFTMAASSV